MHQMLLRYQTGKSMITVTDTFEPNDVPRKRKRTAPIQFVDDCEEPEITQEN
jgi:hypothetical protein